MGDTLDGFPDFFQHAVNQLMAACPGSSVGSGSRSNEEQAHLYATKGPWSPSNPGAAAPGTSNHEVGVGHGAADMSGNLECLHAKAAQFGLFFPMDNEPWHIEPTDVLIEQGMEFFGMAPEEEQADSLDAVRQMIFGGAPNPAAPDVPERAAAGFKAKEMPQGEIDEEFAKNVGLTSGVGEDGDPISDAEAAQFFAQAGFSGEALVTMLATAIGESGLDPDVMGDTTITTSKWGPSAGLAQIRSLREQTGTGGWRDISHLTDPSFNARAAWSISNGGTNFTPWTVYKTGKWKSNLDRARAAVAQLGSGAVAKTGGVVASTRPDLLDPADLGLDDPAGVSQEIAEMILAQRSGTPDVLKRLGEPEKVKADA